VCTAGLLIEEIRAFAMGKALPKFSEPPVLDAFEQRYALLPRGPMEIAQQTMVGVAEETAAIELFLNMR